ncbi:MAG: DUF2760 domain-containing protein [Nitrospirota bacterium]
MLSRGTALASLVAVTLVAMLAVAFAVPALSEQPPAQRVVLLLIAGVVLSAIFAVIVSKALKSAPARPPEAPPATAALEPVKAPPAEQVSFEPGAVQALSLLQKEGRLIDFLMEDISGFDDRQVGAAVRNIHKECRKAIAEHMDIEPVLPEREGDEVVVREGFDPSALRLTGTVVGPPPFKGTVRHSGWKISAMRMPPIPKSQAPHIVEPAEVEIR